MKNITFYSPYQNLHMDRANDKNMLTVDLTISSNLASTDTPYLIYQYEHGYDYIPQFWGLWDIHYGTNLGNFNRRGYGFITHNTGVGLAANFYYTVDATYVKVYFHYNNTIPGGGGYNTAGTTAKFTGYLFANGRESQNYVD